MSTVEELGQKLDAMGWTLINMGDPVTGDPLPALDWQQVAGLVRDFEEAIEQHKADKQVVARANLELRAANLAHGEALGRIWSRVCGSEQPELAAPEDIANTIIGRLDEEKGEVEVTDAMVESLGAQVFDPSVVWDREKVRLGLANALQTR